MPPAPNRFPRRMTVRTSGPTPIPASNAAKGNAYGSAHGSGNFGRNNIPAGRAVTGAASARRTFPGEHPPPRHGLTPGRGRRAPIGWLLPQRGSHTIALAVHVPQLFNLSTNRHLGKGFCINFLVRSLPVGGNSAVRGSMLHTLQRVKQDSLSTLSWIYPFLAIKDCSHYREKLPELKKRIDAAANRRQPVLI